MREKVRGLEYVMTIHAEFAKYSKPKEAGTFRLLSFQSSQNRSCVNRRMSGVSLKKARQKCLKSRKRREVLALLQKSEGAEKSSE
jgi:hypothetical protein